MYIAEVVIRADVLYWMRRSRMTLPVSLDYGSGVMNVMLHSKRDNLSEPSGGNNNHHICAESACHGKVQ